MIDDTLITETVEKLIRGDDYRESIVKSINLDFMDFAVTFFKKIVAVKNDDNIVSLEWYKNNFINNVKLSASESAIYAGIHKKTIQNIYGTTKRKIVLDIANLNFEYISNLVEAVGEDNDISINISITYKDITVHLSLQESLIVINALATKKIALRGGAWSSIGKKVEKRIMIKLCELAQVPDGYIDSNIFRKDKTLDYDREVDFYLYDKTKNKKYRLEVKLMGKGNPESADTIFARDPDIFVADTLSNQNKNQCKARNVVFLELKNNKNSLNDFKTILKKLNIPFDSLERLTYGG